MQLGRLSVWVSLDSSDTPAEELSTTYDIDRANHSATCYVQVRSGQTWSIHIEDAEPLEPPCVTSCLTYMDGHLVRGAKVHGSKPRQKVDAFWVSEYEEAPLAFGDLQVTDVEHEAVEMNEEDQEALGTIRVTCQEKYRTDERRRQRGNRSENRLPDVGAKILETDKKAVTLGTRCVFGRFRPAQNNGPRNRRPREYGDWDQPPPPPVLRPIPDRPRLTFEFRYRTKLALDLLLGADRPENVRYEEEQRQIDAAKKRSESEVPERRLVGRADDSLPGITRDYIKNEDTGLKTEDPWDVDAYDDDSDDGFAIVPGPVIDLTLDSDSD